MEGMPPGEWNQGEIVVQTFVWARNIWYSGQNPVPEGEYTAEIAMFCQGVVIPTVDGPHVRLYQGALFFQVLVAAVLPPTARHDTPGAEQ
jgi:hypothetical protein